MTPPVRVRLLFNKEGRLMLSQPTPIEDRYLPDGWKYVDYRLPPKLVDSAQLSRLRALSLLGPLSMEDVAWLFSVIDDMAEDLDAHEAESRRLAVAALHKPEER